MAAIPETIIDLKFSIRYNPFMSISQDYVCYSDYKQLLDNYYKLKDNMLELKALMHVALYLSGHKDELLERACEIMEEQNSYMKAYKYAEEHPIIK